LHPKVTEEDLTAKEIMDKVRGSYRRLERDPQDWVECEFLELLRDYPRSMCKRDMSDTLKLWIALVYFESKPEFREYDDDWEGCTYDYLSLIFDRSKASIHQAIREKEREAKQLLQEARLRRKAKQLRMEGWAAEDKKKLLEEILREFEN